MWGHAEHLCGVMLSEVEASRVQYIVPFDFAQGDPNQSVQINFLRGYHIKSHYYESDLILVHSPFFFKLSFTASTIAVDGIAD